MSNFQEPFVELGRKVEAAFSRAQYAEAAFADLAGEHVESARLHEHFDLTELARWVMTGRGIPPQEDIAGSFGEPPVTLWNGRRCFVSVLVWGSSSTSIHQHAFTGVFQVLQGSSVHACHTFVPSLELSEDLSIGDLTCTSIEYLTKGSARPIPGGAAGVHSLFHLDYPSVSLVVRTHVDRRHPIQFAYHPPGIAVWDQRPDPELRRARQFAGTLVRLDARKAEALLSDVLPVLSAFEIYWLLESTRRAGSLDLSLRLLAKCRENLGPVVADAFEAALREDDRRTALYRRRGQVVDPGLRFFLAILLNASSRQEALTLAGAYAPEQPPVESLVGWVVQLQGVKLKIQAGGEAWEPNVLGLPDPDEPSLAALRAALSGQPAAATDTRPFYEAVRRHRTFAPLFKN